MVKADPAPMHPPAALPRHGTAEEEAPLRVLVAGAGAAALELVLALRALAGARVAIGLLSPEAEYVYRPLAAGSPFEPERIQRLALDRFAASLDVARTVGSLCRLDSERGCAWTSGGESLRYDVVALASPPRAREAVPGSLTYRGPADAGRLLDVLEAVKEGRAERLAFVATGGVPWTLPVYELAIAARRWLSAREADAELVVVAAERTPVELLGEQAGAALARLLQREGISLRTGCQADSLEDGRLLLRSGGSLRADRAIALPEPAGRAPAGIPRDDEGFVSVDARGCVLGAPGVYAVGGVIAGAVEQGGVATQQADVVAAEIARRAGASVPPDSPVITLRGVLLTGEPPAYLRPVGRGTGLDVSHAALWWPPLEVDGRHLAARLAGDLDLAAPLARGHVTIERPMSRPGPAAAEGSLSSSDCSPDGAPAAAP